MPSRGPEKPDTEQSIKDVSRFAAVTLVILIWSGQKGIWQLEVEASGYRDQTYYYFHNIDINIILCRSQGAGEVEHLCVQNALILSNRTGAEAPHYIHGSHGCPSPICQDPMRHPPLTPVRMWLTTSEVSHPVAVPKAEPKSLSYVISHSYSHRFFGIP